jgi:hypothetical protein
MELFDQFTPFYFSQRRLAVHAQLRNSTGTGRQIDFNEEEFDSISASIRVSFDPDSNVNDETQWHEHKDNCPRSSTQAGRQNDFSDGVPGNFMQFRLELKGNRLNT